MSDCGGSPRPRGSLHTLRASTWTWGYHSLPEFMNLKLLGLDFFWVMHSASEINCTRWRGHYAPDVPALSSELFFSERAEPSCAMALSVLNHLLLVSSNHRFCRLSYKNGGESRACLDLIPFLLV